ncbi:MAG: DUF4388 domain-containing protein [Candidatus Polarisedimenticolia bacterium]
MALKGTLKDFSLADIFQLIGIQKKTGVLTLKGGQEVVTVSFVDGDVVGADALNRRLEDRLGTVLVKTGRITEGQLQEALRIQKSTLKRMGNILVENRFIDANALRAALQIQISQMIYRLFRWSDGEYNFTQETRVDFDREHVVPTSAESILMEGARILDEWPMIEKAIRSLNAVFQRAGVEVAPAARGEASAPAPDEAARAVTLNEQEMIVWNLVDGRRSVQEVVERSTLGEFDTCRVMFDLIGRQLLEEARPGAQKAVAPAAKAAAAPRGSPLVLGLGYLVIVVLAGGAVLFRAQEQVGELARGGGAFTALGSLARPTEVRGIRRAIGRSRLQRIDFALQVYYLLNRGYPQDLRNLVTTRLLKPAGIIDPWGRPIQLEVSPRGYRVWTAAPPDEPEGADRVDRISSSGDVTN